MKRKISEMEGLEFITSLEIAISICTTSQIKDIVFKKVLKKSFQNIYYVEKQYLSESVKEIRETTFKILEQYFCPPLIAEKIYDIALLICIKLLKWAHYMYYIFEIPFESTRDVVKRSLFNQQGIIDYLAALNELIADTRIKRLKRMKIFRYICFGIKSIIAFNKACREVKVNITIKENRDLVNLPTIRKQWIDSWINAKLWTRFFLISLKPSILEGNYIIFENFPMPYVTVNGTEITNSILQSIADKYEGRGLNVERRWVPKDYFMNLFLCVFEKFNEEEITEIFKISEGNYCFNVLKGLLDWPFQVHFLRYAQLMWGILNVQDFARILLKIIDKNVEYEGRIYNYSLLFKHFWLNAPESYKNFVCTKVGVITYATIIMDKLFRLDPFTHFDKYNLKLLFEHFKKIRNSDVVFDLLKNITLKLISKQMYKLADIFFECILLPELILDFKINYIISLDAKYYLKFLLSRSRLHEADFLVSWCLLSENSCEIFKINFLRTRAMKNFIEDLLRKGRSELVDAILFWGFGENNEVWEYRISLGI